jgi:dolichyl-phosphate beta-glucosyltransferase
MDPIRTNAERRTSSTPVSRSEQTNYPRPHVEIPSESTETRSLSIVIPAYNEQDRIGDSLAQIYEYIDDLCIPFELMVVDDGSSDSTCDVVERFASSHPGTLLIRTWPNRGKGNAVRVGMLRARGSHILFSDADLATPIKELDRLFMSLDSETPVAIGSRAARGAVLAVRQPWYRELAGRTLNQLVRRLAVPRISDTQCGFKLFRRDAAHDLFARSLENGFGFDIEILHLAGKRGYRIAEVPVAWEHREGSKVRIVRDSLRMLGTLARLVTRDLGGATRK